MDAPETLHRHVIVHGRVQGVGYRAWAAQEAYARGLMGFVRNRRDGTVEALFAGPPDAVLAMVEACARGPAAAEVARIHARAGSEALLDLVRPGELFSMLPTV